MNLTSGTRRRRCSAAGLGPPAGARVDPAVPDRHWGPALGSGTGARNRGPESGVAPEPCRLR
ncbi:hypothetical protein C731_3953 [Mycolicibacterium hassiacum DSM 44199]|uniref:Uncharacterized protein n=1 Tax=Mycolicibacterium hassiacum (strain DSM 44199 / CIP 105218 / JCM 12690 / 3849) TaxID=1122247 RepID=K5BE76_MYCHD|nr:hypothetical protein C731_3953 [Mycolicibacterium hassiacum DSM 44199]